MSPFITGHATNAQALVALAAAAAQVDSQRASRALPFEPTLALLYITDHYADQAERVFDQVKQRWPGIAVAGSIGIGVATSGIEYFDEPALVLMLADLDAEQFGVFNGRTPPQPDAWSALVHADPRTPDLAELIVELSLRTESRYLFGGLASARNRTLTFADGVFEGGLSGVAFTRNVALVSRVTQGCQPVGAQRAITGAQRNVVLTLDGQPALALLMADLGLDLGRPEQAARRLAGTLVGLTNANDAALARSGQFGADTRVRHLLGIDLERQAIAVADLIEPGMQLAFCTRDVEAARRDLVRICTEIREEVEAGALAAVGAHAGTEAAGRRIAGALYVSCSGRGGPHFGAPSAELQIVRRALGDVPLAGFFAAGEIARHHLYGYTGVLTVFVAD